MKILNCIIVEDNEIDQLMLTHLAKQYSFLNVVGVFSSAEEFLESNENVDLAFLDIDLPGSNGIELRKSIMHIPACIFVSSHPEFAVDSFEVDALDFISKPLKKERFEASMRKVQDYFSMKEKLDFYDLTFGNKTLNIREGHQVIQINIDEVHYLEALKDYTQLITDSRKYFVLKSIGQILKEEYFGDFIRVHKSFAVPKRFITKKTSSEIMVNNRFPLPVGRAFKANLDFFDA